MSGCFTIVRAFLHFNRFMNIQIFEHDNLGSVRTFTEKDKIVFVANDVANMLGFKDVKDALSRHCKRMFTKKIETHKRGMQSLNCIYEDDLYRLTFGSKIKGAIAVQDYFFEVVIPAVRKHGMYATKDLLQDPERLNESINALKQDYKLLEKDNKVLKKELSTLATHKGALILNPIRRDMQTPGFKIIDYAPELRHVSIIEQNDHITVFAHRPKWAIHDCPEFRFSQQNPKVLKTVDLNNNIAMELVNKIADMLERKDVRQGMKVLGRCWIPNSEYNYNWLLDSLEDHVKE
jgi:prophage antirepressor-like protein